MRTLYHATPRDDIVKCMVWYAPSPPLPAPLRCLPRSAAVQIPKPEKYIEKLKRIVRGYARFIDDQATGLDAVKEVRGPRPMGPHPMGPHPIWDPAPWGPTPWDPTLTSTRCC